MSQNNQIHISIIIPCYNAANKIEKCIRSLKEIQFPKNNYEVIFVDDFSSDNTVKLINSELKKQNNWSLHILKRNSGSPSKPRNVGTTLATGEYIFYLDCDDQILTDSLKKQYDIAKQENACIVRGSLIIDANGKQVIANQIKDFPYEASKETKIKKIITTQSTTSPSLVKKFLITENSITWEEDIRIGEDTLFLIDVFNYAINISYLDDALFIYNKTIQKEASSTQTYGARELKNHLYVWSEAEKRLSKFGFSYFEVRGKVALRTSFQGIVNHYQQDIDPKLFGELSTFINNYKEIVNKFVLRPRFKKALGHLQENRYSDFFLTLKADRLTATDDLYDYLIHAIPYDHCEQFNSFKLIRHYTDKGMTPKKVLDFGCGVGDSSAFFNALLPDTEWFGVDLFLSTATDNREDATTSAEPLTFNTSSFSYKEEKFDLIYSNHVLEHLPEPEQALSDIAKLLTNDGLFIGQTSQYETCISFSFWNFTVYGFKKLIEKAGMKLVELRPGPDSFSSIQRSYTMDFNKYNKYYSFESPVNIEIEQDARELKKSNTVINYRKLMYCGDFCFVCTLK